MVKVKICGITNLKDALVAQEAGTDFLGFIFANSPRKIGIESAREIITKISPDVKITALFVNEKKEIVDRVNRGLGRVDLLQFHGDETPAYCRQFTGLKVIKALRIRDRSSLEQIAGFKGANFLLLDSFKQAQYGGTGQAFDWSLAQEAKSLGLPILLSGGLNPDNVKEAILRVDPFGVDVSSGVEREPGRKDPELVKSFITVAKSV